MASLRVSRMHIGRESREGLDKGEDGEREGRVGEEGRGEVLGGGET